MNSYKLWKSEARLDYSSDRPQTKSHTQKASDSRSRKQDAKLPSSARGYVSDGPASSSRAPTSTYPSSTLPSSSKPSHAAQPTSTAQYPPATSLRPPPPPHTPSYAQASHQPRYPDPTYESRTYSHRPTAPERAAPSSQDQARPPEDPHKSSRHRTQQDALPATTFSPTPVAWAPTGASQEIHKVHRKPVPSLWEKEKEGGRAKDSDRARETERAKTRDRDALKDQENRYEEERRLRREARHQAKEREREDRHRDEERRAEQRGREELYRQEQTRDILQDRDRRREPSRHQIHVPTPSKSHRVKESDESDNSMQKPVPSIRHRHHNREPASHNVAPPTQTFAPAPTPLAQGLANYSENIPYATARDQQRQPTVTQPPQPVAVASSERPSFKHSSSSHSAGGPVPYPPGYAVSGDQDALRNDRKKQERSRLAEPQKASPPRPSPSATNQPVRPVEPQPMQPSTSRSSQKPEKQPKRGLGDWFFNRSSEATGQKPQGGRHARSRTTSNSKPPPQTTILQRAEQAQAAPQLVSLKAGQGPSDQPVYDQGRQRAAPLQTSGHPVDVSRPLAGHMPSQGQTVDVAQGGRSGAPGPSKVDASQRQPAPQPWGANSQWSYDAPPANGAFRAVVPPSPSLPQARLPPPGTSMDAARSPIPPAPYLSPHPSADPHRPLAPPSPYLAPPAPLQTRVPSADSVNPSVLNGRAGLQAPGHVPGTRQRTSPQRPSAALNSTESRGDVHQTRPVYPQESPRVRNPPATASHGATQVNGYANGSAHPHPPTPYLGTSNSRPVAPDLAAAFPINEDALAPYRRAPANDHSRPPQSSRTNTHQSDPQAVAKDANFRQDSRSGVMPVVNYGNEGSRPVRSTKTPSPGQHPRLVPHSTPPKTTSQPAPVSAPPAQSYSDHTQAYDPSRPNVYGSTPAYPAPAAYPTPSPRIHLEATPAPYPTNVSNTNGSYYPSPKPGSVNPSPRSQTHAMTPSQGPPPPVAAHVTQRTPSHETGSTTLLGHTPSSQGSLPMPSTSPAVQPQTFGPGPYVPSSAAPSHNRSQSASMAAATPVRQSSSRHQHSTSVPSPALPPGYATSAPPPQSRSHSQPHGPRGPISPTPVRAYTSPQAASDPNARVPVSGHPSTPAPVRAQQRRVVPPSPSEDSDGMNTPSSLAHSNLKLPDLAPIAPVMSIQSYQEPKKKSGFFGLFRSKSTTGKQQPNGNFVPAKADVRGQPPSKVSSTATIPLHYESDSKVQSMSAARKRTAAVAAPAPTHARVQVRSADKDKRSNAQAPFVPFRILSKRNRTMSGASAEAVDGTNAGASTVLTSPAGSTRSPTPKLPPVRDPIQAAHEWRVNEEVNARSHGRRRRRPGVHFEGYEDHPQAEKNKPNYVARVRAR